MKPELSIVPGDEPRTTTVDRGPYRAIVSEHVDRELVYLALSNGAGNAAGFFEPVAALAIADALLKGAAAALDHQFRRQLGSPWQRKLATSSPPTSSRRSSTAA